MNKISWTVESLVDLKKCYEEACDFGNTEFEFQGHPMYTAYAKYLIEFLEGEFARRAKYYGQAEKN